MNRGKQQVLLNYLPGKTFDFEKIGTIARVERVRGVPRTDLNVRLILRAIADQIQPWSDDHRPVFRDLEQSTDRFVLVEPRNVEAAMFPLVFWCQNAQCGATVEFQDTTPSNATCQRCRNGRLVQLRFIRVHRCGAIEALSAQTCSNGHAQRAMALDTRGSERFSEFQWVCRSCRRTASVFGGRCRACNWPGNDPATRNMNVEVHRAGRTYYPHSTVLLNQPGTELTAFLGMDQWQAVAAASFLQLPEIDGRSIREFASVAADPGRASASLALTDADRARLRANGMADDAIKMFEEMQSQLRAGREEAAVATSPAGLAAILSRKSGVSSDVWERAGQEMLEAVMPSQSGDVTELFRPGVDDRATAAGRRIGFGAVTLASDFPITTATYGYSRVDYQPDTCRINPFPPDPDHGGRFPIFVDVVQADAILLRLDHRVVLEWMEANGCTPSVPPGADPDVAARAYFVRLLDGVSLRETIVAREARLVFGLLHTLSHVAVRRAVLLCGLDATSLSEYLLPKALTIALYCNHRFGATIGALSALFEQSMADWLAEVRGTRRCVYDPVCLDAGGACHACVHLPETSCRFFNLNLGRAFLIGGRDPEFGEINIGFLDFVSGE